MSRISDPAYVSKQYRDASNLNARIQLHARFSTNKCGWHRWAFDQLDLPPQCRILELGCGPGDLWLQNMHRLQEGWQLTLSDLLPGMVREAEGNLGHNQRQFTFLVINAQSIPFADQRFEIVIANHMLYHVPDRARALSEIQRALRPGGHFYATTVGRDHLRELAELVHRFDPSLACSDVYSVEDFTLESGSAQLSEWFSDVIVRRYEDMLVVTEIEPLVEYVASGRDVSDEWRAGFAEMAEQELASGDGAIHITKDSGILKARLLDT